MYQIFTIKICYKKIAQKTIERESICNDRMNIKLKIQFS